MNSDEHSAWVARVRAEYEKDPAIGPFTKQPVPFGIAAMYGLNSFARAAKRANDNEEGT